MDSNIFSQLTQLFQHHSDSQDIMAQHNLSAADMHNVASEMIPRITDKLSQSPDKMGDLMSIFAKNQHNPDSLLNSQPGFDQQQAQSEGHEILHTIFGRDGQTAQLTDEIAQKTGIDANIIHSILPMLAAMLTKFFGNNSADNPLSSLLGSLQGNRDQASNNETESLASRIFGYFFRGKNN